MELNDIVYLLLMIVFVVFGIFNDSKKKKNKSVNENTYPDNNSDKDFKEIFRELFDGVESKVVTPPIPKKVLKSERENPIREKRFKQSNDLLHGFEPSMSLVTNFKDLSSLKGYDFIDESLEVMDLDDSLSATNPLIKDLIGVDKQSEARKAIVYSEIINRKY